MTVPLYREKEYDILFFFVRILATNILRAAKSTASPSSPAGQGSSSSQPTAERTHFPIQSLLRKSFE